MRDVKICLIFYIYSIQMWFICYYMYRSIYSSILYCIYKCKQTCFVDCQVLQLMLFLWDIRGCCEVESIVGEKWVTLFFMVFDTNFGSWTCWKSMHECPKISILIQYPHFFQALVYNWMTSVKLYLLAMFLDYYQCLFQLYFFLS